MLCARGKNFTHAVTNQPVCAPARSVLMTSRYATETGVWHNGLALDQSLPTLAGELRKSGYSANLIGKWHLAPESAADGGGPGFVKPEFRGGFLDLWEGSNALEHTSHPYEGSIFDGAGNEITYKDEYRVDFITDRVERFLRQKHDKPFLLFVSQLEPHQQNDMHRPVGPKGSVERFANSTVPDDLREFPGTWQAQLPDYYGCMREHRFVGGPRAPHPRRGAPRGEYNFRFMSDHGCHFMTRNQEYKRSTHNSSLRIPLLIEGRALRARNGSSSSSALIDLAPTLLEAAGIPAPPDEGPQPGAAAQRCGGSAVLAEPTTYPDQRVDDRAARSAPGLDLLRRGHFRLYKRMLPAANSYHEYQMYDQRADPSELVNLAGRQEYRAKADELRDELTKLLAEAGEPAAAIQPAKLYP
jgi:arylsulfatase A-like enzyme